MKIGLIQVDGSMPNLALMKLAAFHKKRGDDVTVLDISNLSFDRIYASKVFVGGTGIDLKSELPPDIELQVPDYEKFKTDYSIGFTSRGCIRDCGFCIVKEKEGSIRECSFDWISHHKVLLLDNNFLASPKWREKLEYFSRQKLKVSFNQGLDIRLINQENAALLAKVLYYDLKFSNRRLYFSFDSPNLRNVVQEKIKVLNDAGIPSPHLMFYVLVGYDTSLTEDLDRIQLLIDLGCLPFVMLYNHKPDHTLRSLQRWVNHRLYKLFPFHDYDSHYRGKKVLEAISRF